MHPESETIRKRNLYNRYAINWVSSVSVEEWFGVTVGKVKGKKRITRIELPQGHTIRYSQVTTTPSFKVEERQKEAEGPTLWGVIPDALGELTGLGVINFTDQRLRGSIPASIGQLPRLHTLFLGGNRLQTTDEASKLPTFEHPEVMRRIRLTPNGCLPGRDNYCRPGKAINRKRPFQYTDDGGTIVKSCVPAVWVDNDDTNDNLSSFSKRSLRGEAYGRTGESRLPGCPSSG